MKRNVFSAVFALVFAAALSANAADDGLDGLAIAQKAKDFNYSTTGVVTAGTMTVKDLKSNKVETRKVITIAIKNGGLDQSVFRFLDGSYKGTTFLSLEQKGKDNLQYLYLSSVGSPRQIEASDKEKKFVDTDLSNEDMGGMKIEDFTYNRLPDAKVGPYDCYVIEKMPKKSNSKYSKHVISLDKASMIPVVAKVYNKSNRLVKQAMAKDIKKIAPTFHLPSEIAVKDLEENHETIIKVTYAAEQAVSKGYFNKNKLNSAWAEEKFAK